MKIDEGYIKFNCNWTNQKLSIPEEIILKIRYWRNIFKKQNTIGVTPGGIGFGNISIRINETDFYITGSSTGRIFTITDEHISKVTRCDVAGNAVDCTGLIKASSESLSHYSIYRSSPDIRSVIHIHDKRIWKKYQEILPTSNPHSFFGSVELARDVEEIARSKKSKILITAGHEDGVFAFGHNIDDAGEHLINLQRYL